jgi:DNA-binding response OmpR family regulator
MSMLWLVSPNDEWSDEAHHVFSGIFATRRVASIQSFIRILSLGGSQDYENVFVILRLIGDESEVLMHQAIEAFVGRAHKAQMVSIGTPSEGQRRVLEAHDVALLGVQDDHLRLANFIKSLIVPVVQPKSGAVSINSKLQVGDLEIDITTGTFRILATDIKDQLSPKEMRIVRVLAESANRQVARDDLVCRVWPGLKVSASTVDSHMSRLRKKIDQSFECSLETEYGSGWRLSVKS